MSYVEIFKFDKNGNPQSIAKIKNSWRGAMAVWNILGKKYCGHSASPFDLSAMKRIWNLADDEHVPMDERIVLCTTFDKCLIRKNDIPRVVSAFRIFEGEASLKEQADVLEELITDNNCIAVGWHQNSTSCEQWFSYNCLEQSDHYYLFDDLEESEGNLSITPPRKGARLGNTSLID